MLHADMSKTRPKDGTRAYHWCNSEENTNKNCPYAIMWKMYIFFGVEKCMLCETVKLQIKNFMENKYTTSMKVETQIWLTNI